MLTKIPAKLCSQPKFEASQSDSLRANNWIDFPGQFRYILNNFKQANAGFLKGQRLDEMYAWAIGITVIFMIAGAVQATNVNNPGKELHAKFVNLGTLSGRTKDEVVAAVRTPSSISAIGESQTLLQWQATGCHMVLRFTGEICDGITHEHLHQG